MIHLLKILARDEAGATMIEWGLMVMLIAIACIGSVTLFGANLAALFAGEAAAIP